MTKIRAAVIGLGRIGSLYDLNRRGLDPLSHAGGYAASPDVELAAGVDPDGGRRAQFMERWHVPAFATLEEMVASVRPEIWSVCTEARWYREVIERAREGGARAIFCEKPLSDDWEQACQIVSICEHDRLPLLVNHSRRFDSLHQEIAAGIAAHRWEATIRVIIHYTRGILNYGTHAFDLIRMLLRDEIAWVGATNELKESEADPSLTVHGETGCGVPFLFLPTARRGYDSFEVDVWCSNGRVTLTHLGRELREYEVAASTYWDEPAVLVERVGERVRTGMTNVISAAIHNLVNHLHRGEPLMSTGRDGLAALAAVLACRVSSASDGARVPPHTLSYSFDNSLEATKR